MKKDELRYLQRLAEIYPTIGKASTEIINLQSILNLPKGTEHFMSDLHGEYQAFSHVLRNGSGAVRKKIDDVFGHTLSNNDKRSLATLIYYPKEKMDLVKDTEEDMENWYKITLYRLIEICKTTASMESIRRWISSGSFAPFSASFCACSNCGSNTSFSCRSCSFLAFASASL